MTAAQRLYASSGNSATTAPMINANSITNLSTSVDIVRTASQPSASTRVSILPTPTLTSPVRNESSRPMSYLPQAPLNSHRLGADVPYSLNTRSEQNSHRAATAPAFPMPTPTLNARLHSQSVGAVAPHSYSSISGLRPTPHLVTTARPPPFDTGAQYSKVDLVTSPAPPLKVQSVSPPSTSLLFSKPAESVSSHNRPGSVTSTIGISEHSNQFGATLGTNAGSHDSARVLAMLKTALSMNPIAESELRDVAYAELNANFQTVLNALKHQQRYRPSGMGVPHRPTQSIDYQLLIAEVERLEMKVTLAQQTQQQQMALDALKKQQETYLIHQQQQQLILNQQAHQQALLHTQLQQKQDTSLAQQHALLNQQTQEQATQTWHIQQQHQLHMQQQQQYALGQQNYQAQEQMLAQQQALLQANHQLLAQHSAPVNHSQLNHSTSPATHHQAEQQHHGGLGSIMNSVMGGPIQQKIVSHLVSSAADSAVHSLFHGFGSSSASANGTTSDGGNGGLMDSMTQTLNNFNGGQDFSSGLFGDPGNLDLNMIPDP